MYQRECEDRQSSNAGLLSKKRSRVLILGPGGRQDHFTQILAANVQQWGYKASILSTSAVLGGGQDNIEVEGDILVYDLDDPLYMSTLSAGKATKGQSFATPFLASSSVSRFTLEQIGAVALLYKPFEMERLQRYLRVFQQVLFDESAQESGNSDGLSQASTTSIFMGEEVHEDRKRLARILVVEDNPHVADAIRQCLEFEPSYEIRIAEDGLKALEQCVEWRPQCIVTDLLLPYMDGYQIMRTLSAAATQQMPAFVVISALMQHELPEYHVYPHGKSVVFIDKPFQIENLLDVVDRALA
jgi:CheY-like chemotaxis protein